MLPIVQDTQERKEEMTPEKVKALFPVLTAYAENKTIQMQNDVGVWFDLCYATFDSPAECYRIKPDPIILKYRRYILTDHKGFYVSSISQNLNEYADVNKIEKMSCFVRWIDNDWVTYECEV